MTQIAAAKIEKKTYTYTDAAGQAAFEVWYFNDNGRKEVYQRRPSGEPDGSWLLGLDAGEYMRAAPDRKIWAPFNAAKFEKYSATGQRKVFNTAAPVIPYQLRELRDAVAAGRMIYLAANEEEAEFIRGFGFVATCCAGGAENWRRPELNVLLRGADVVLYNGAKLIAQSLAPIVRRLRIVDFEGDTVEELTTRTAAAKDYKPDYVVSDPESPAAAPAANVTPLITPNSREVRESITTLAAQAKAATKHLRDPGLLQIILIHPLTENVGTIYRYALDDPNLIERMTGEAVNASESGHNVYIEGRTVRRGLSGKQRGGLNDTVAVFALVVDSDADKGKAWTPTVPVSLTVNTSPDNHHYWLFSETALDPAAAQKLGARLRAATNADDDTGNVCQPYRIAGTVNYPGKKKLERGRVITPTHSLGFDPETLWTPERIEQEFQPSSKPTNDGEDPDRSKVPEGVESSGQYEKLGEGPYDPHAEPELIAAALAVIPHNDNDKHSDNYWNEIEKTPGRKYMIQVGMAVKAASNNSAEGFTLFNNWRSGAPDYNADNVRKKWEGFHPTKIGFGTLSFYADKAAPGWREEYEARKASTQSTQQQAGAGLPELIVNDSDPTATAKDLATLIAKQDDFLFIGYVPVHVVAEADCMPRALEVTTEMVRILAHEICVPVQEKKVKKGKTVGVANVPVPLSNDIARLYLHGLEGRWELKPFNGITTAPILSNNGTIRTASGYDLRSGLWCYNIPDITVPTRPTKDDAEQALRLLRWFFRTFPFADAIRGLDRDLAVEVVDLTKPAGLDESSFLAALMTSVSRQSLELAPGFLCDAPNYSGAGTGKGLLSQGRVRHRQRRQAACFHQRTRCR